MSAGKHLWAREKSAYLDEAAGKAYEIPGSRRTTVSVRTLERYLSLYRKGGWDALKPQPRKSKGNFKIPAAVLQKAIELRRQRPERSMEQIIFLLKESGEVPPNSIAASTLARHLKKAGVRYNSH